MARQTATRVNASGEIERRCTDCRAWFPLDRRYFYKACSYKCRRCASAYELQRYYDRRGDVPPKQVHALISAAEQAAILLQTLTSDWGHHVEVIEQVA